MGEELILLSVFVTPSMQMLLMQPATRLRAPVLNVFVLILGVFCNAGLRRIGRMKNGNKFVGYVRGAD